LRFCIHRLSTGTAAGVSAIGVPLDHSFTETLVDVNVWGTVRSPRHAHQKIGTFGVGFGSFIGLASVGVIPVYRFLFDTLS